MIRKNPRMTARQMKAKLSCIKRWSVRRIQNTLLQNCDLPSRHAAKKPFLSAAMKAKRLEFATNHSTWSVAKWRTVMFSDESWFELWFGGRFARVRRPRGSNRFDPKFTCKTVKHPQKQMVWGCFSWAGRGRLAFLDKGDTMNQHSYLAILKEKLQPAMRHAKTTRFLQDGAPCHRARAVKDWLAVKDMNVMDWPGNSPDLNPIENMWNWMKAKLCDRPPPSNLAKLRKEVSKLWCERTSVEYCRNLVRSMPNRMAMVMASGREMTKY